MTHAPEPSHDDILRQVAIFGERQEQHWERTQDALKRNEQATTTLAQTSVRHDVYEARHAELVSIAQQGLDGIDRLRTELGRHFDDVERRIIALEKGNATLLARYAVLGTIAILIIAPVIGYLIHVITD